MWSCSFVGVTFFYKQMKTLRFYNNSRACCICVYCTRQVFTLAAWEKKTPFFGCFLHIFMASMKSIGLNLTVCLFTHFEQILNRSPFHCPNCCACWKCLPECFFALGALSVYPRKCRDYSLNLKNNNNPK